MDRLDELALFIAVLDSESMAAAGRRLHRSPPSVSRILAGLEERLGARLIHRTTRRLAPTEFGRQFAAEARALLAHYDGLTRTVVGRDLRPTGMLRLTAPAVFGRRHVAPILSAFLTRFDQIRATLILSDRNLDLLEDDLDIAIRIGNLADSALIRRETGSVRHVLVASPAYLARRGAPQSPNELATHDTILIDSRPTSPSWRFTQAAGSRKRHQVIALTPRIYANDVEAALTMAREGQGIVQALSYQVIDDVESGRLVRLLPGADISDIPVQLVSIGSPHKPARISAFLAFAAPVLKDRLKDIADRLENARTA